ncbi:MAG: hypothetical protein RXO32_11595 [Thermoproteus sp.]
MGMLHWPEMVRQTADLVRLAMFLGFPYLGDVAVVIREGHVQLRVLEVEPSGEMGKTLARPAPTTRGGVSGYGCERRGEG